MTNQILSPAKSMPVQDSPPPNLQNGEALCLFLAIPVPGQPGIPCPDIAGPDMRFDRPWIDWVKQDNLHVTLHYFGKSSPNERQAIEHVSAQCAHRHPPFILRLRPPSPFPGPSRPRVIACETGFNNHLHALVSDLRKQLGQRHRTPAPRPFRGHLTLGRIRNPNTGTGESGSRWINRLRNAYQGHTPQLSVRELVLYHSRRGTTGNDYIRLASWFLGNTDRQSAAPVTLGGSET